MVYVKPPQVSTDIWRQHQQWLDTVTPERKSATQDSKKMKPRGRP